MLATLALLLAEDPAPPGGGGGPNIGLILAIMVLFFLVVLRPMMRESRQQKEMLAQLKPNDKVVTSGGLVGVVVAVGKDDEANEVTLRSDNSRVRVLKSHIVQVVPAGKDAPKEKDKEPAAGK
jgi:preprotein translocase subunit YajC